MRTLAIVNQKGGCGKTTTAINLAAVYAGRGCRTLLVDMDPQAHCAAGLGIPEDRIDFSLAEALVADHGRGFDPDSLIWEAARNLFLAPSTMRLAAMEAHGGGLHDLPDKDRRLASLLQLLQDDYEMCLIDCPPTIGLLTFNALRAAREALVPVETSFFAMKGASKQWNTIQRTIQHIGRPIACHLVPTLHRPQTRIAREILAALQRDFAGQIIPIVIREHEILREAATLGQPIIEYAPGSEAHQDFEKLADWLDAHRSEPQMPVEVTADATASLTSRFEASRGGPAAPSHAAGDESSGSRAAELAQRVRGLIQTEALPASGAAAAAAGQPGQSGQRGVHGPPAPPGSPRGPASPVQFPRTGAAGPAIPAASPAPALGAAASGSGPGSAPPAIPPEPPRPIREEIARVETLPANANGNAARYGARQTEEGVRFVQPGDRAMRIAVAGDFNHWSPLSHPLRYNPESNVHEATIRMPPGEHHYRLVCNGRWQADPYNPLKEVNPYGETNSVIVVENEPPRPAEPVATSGERAE